MKTSFVAALCDVLAFRRWWGYWFVKWAFEENVDTNNLSKPKMAIFCILGLLMTSSHKRGSKHQFLHIFGWDAERIQQPVVQMFSKCDKKKSYEDHLIGRLFSSALDRKKTRKKTNSIHFWPIQVNAKNVAICCWITACRFDKFYHFIDGKSVLIM